MMQSINYQKELEKICEQAQREGVRYKLMLHSCCAPCSSYCLVYLRRFFDITCLYYNPNITDENEYRLRVSELHRLAESLNNDPVYIAYGNAGSAFIEIADEHYLDECGKIAVIEADYDPQSFISEVSDRKLAKEPEGGARCEMCFDMRLSQTLKTAESMDFEYFTTSLTISPLKNANILNSIGFRLSNESAGDVKWLPSDFKKKNGYLLSVELCKRYEMYRQDYCGCVYSMRDRIASVHTDI